MNTFRFLVPGDVKPNAHLTMFDDRAERQYSNTDAQPDLLAQLASDRKAGDQLIVNFYEMTTDYFVNDTLAALDLVNIPSELINHLRTALWYRSLYGKGILLNFGGRIKAASPRGYWPLMENGDRIGHVLIIPFSTVSGSGALTGHSNLPDRALVLETVDDVSSKATIYQYSGITLGSPLQGLAAPFQISVFGSGRSDYASLPPVIEAIDSNLKAGNRIISRHSQPHLQVPAGVIDYNENGDPSLNLSTEGDIFPVQRDDKNVQYVTLQADTSLLEFMVNTLLTQLAALTSLPLHVFNQAPLARLDSGAGVDLLSAPATEKTQVWLDDIIRAASEVMLALTALDTEPEAVAEPQQSTT